MKSAKIVLLADKPVEPVELRRLSSKIIQDIKNGGDFATDEEVAQHIARIVQREVPSLRMVEARVGQNGKKEDEWTLWSLAQ